VIIAGGGPAGLNAALMLGRVRRTVLSVDAGSPRNSRSESLHGFLSQDGADPADRPRRAWRQPERPVLGTRKDNAADVVARLRTIGLQVVRNTRVRARTAGAIAAGPG